MPKPKPRPSNDSEDLNRFVTFTGTISRDDVVVPIKFRVRFGVDGELRFRVYPLKMTTEALDLRAERSDRKSNKAVTYKVSAESAGGTRFESDGIMLKGSGHKVTQTSAHVTFKFDYTKATFTRAQVETDAPPVVRWNLRGFEAFPAVYGECAVGKVGLLGNYPEKRPDRVTGLATIIAQEPVADTSVWLADAERLFHHLRDVMSLAMSRQIAYPVRDTWADGKWERVAYSQTRSRRTYQHVFHPMQLQPVFDAALASYCDPPIRAKGLNYAIEWLTLPVTYSEMRLTNAITTLEHLTGANLGPADQVFLPEKAFEKFAKRLRRLAADDLAATFSDVDAAQTASIDAMCATFPAKMQDLNRRPLFDRIMMLADRWCVPLDGLDAEALRAAITARNRVVHRGYYYEPERGSREQVDLWDHLLLVREVAIRFALTVIGYRGTYLSFRGGQHDVAFPPTQKDQGAGTSSSRHEATSDDPPKEA